jgi:hypothetical protein
MALEGTKASTDPAVLTDDVTGVGKLQGVRALLGPLGSQSLAPGDATDGYFVQARNTQGPLSSGQPIGTTKPVPIGVRGNDGAPAPADTPDDFVWLWAGLDGALNSYNRLDGDVIWVATVQSVATSYLAGDVIGAVLQFNNATLAASRGCTINGVLCEDTSGGSAADINLALFEASPAGVPADSAQFSGLTHANRLAAGPICIVKFAAGNFEQGLCDGQINGGPFSKNGYPAGTTVFGVAYFGTTVKTPLATGSLNFGLDVTFN